MKKFKALKMASITLAAVMSFTMLFTGCEKKTSGSELTAIEVSRLMGNGINLGNTMEAYGHTVTSNTLPASSFEGLWGQPSTTQAIIDGMKEAGFDTLRVPVAWTNGMAYESGDYTISEALLNRVDEIIGYAMNNDMYVIVNDHWDGGWWGMFGSASEETRTKAMDMYTSMWTQIAKRYEKYDDKLVFESANEELGDRLNETAICKDTGALTKDECYEKTNEINSAFVKTIRAAGGNNKNRFLLIAGYNTDIKLTCSDKFKMPEDTAKNKLLVSVHYYTPSNYTLEEGISNWGTKRDYQEMNAFLEMMTKFTNQGYGVIIGEYGALPTNSKVKEGTDRFTSNFLDNCDYYNYVPVLWDCNGLYKRLDGKIKDETMAQIFKDRSLSSQSALSIDDEKANAKARMDEVAANAPASFEGDIIELDSNTAVAWIMYQSADYTVTYSVGDVYNPGSKTTGLEANDAIINGAGTYTVSLDLRKVLKAKGTSFCALAIANGEVLYPNYMVTIDEIKIGDEVFTAENEYYTCTDDGITTRVNLYNGWVNALPDEARSNGDLSKASAQNLKLADNKKISTLEVTFTYAPAE